MLNRKYLLTPLAALVGALVMGACSSSSDSGDAAGDTADVGDILDDVDVADDIDVIDTGDVDVSDTTDDDDAPVTSPPGSPPGDGLVEVTTFGMINVSQLDPALPPAVGGSIISAEFNISEEPQFLAEISDDFGIVAEMCQVLSLDVEIDSVETESISAGDNIVITSPAGTFATLVPESTGGDLNYVVEPGATLPSPLPSGLTADVPGDVFPAFASASIPDVEPLTGIEPTDPDNMAFSWDAGSNPDPLVAITVLNLESGSGATCFAADNGAFSFPAEIQTELGADFTADSFSLIRLDSNFLFQGVDVLVLTNNTVSFSATGFGIGDGSVTSADTALLRTMRNGAIRALTAHQLDSLR